MRTKKVIFKNRYIPLLLVFPQLLITLIFFIWPAVEAVWQSFFVQDAFGLHRHFVGLKNFYYLFASPDYIHSIMVTFIFSVAMTLLTMVFGLLIAYGVQGVLNGKGIYKTLFIWPYAVAPAVAGIIWRFLFNPAVGIVSYGLDKIGIHWNYVLQSHQALLLIIITAAWQQFSYNFLFFLTGMQAIPRSLLEAAAIDGAGRVRTFFSIIFPLLSPMTFFLLIMNMIYAFFSTFGIIAIMTAGGPANSTTTLVYKVYHDGFLGMNVGSSAAQSVILMLIVVLLTVIQFRFVERRVHY